MSIFTLGRVAVMSLAVPFDTLAFVKELETAGFSTAQAEAQAKALSGVLQKVEESRLQELATKGDVKAAVDAAKVDITRCSSFLMLDMGQRGRKAAVSADRTPNRALQGLSISDGWPAA
ncbi:MAG: DUF1640 domain-containing protein, partial [Magnetococcales bacterium]|nr:DUF1640 domain-containing protein [Magnetococcales bacterium]